MMAQAGVFLSEGMTALDDAEDQQEAWRRPCVEDDRPAEYLGHAFTIQFHTALLLIRIEPVLFALPRMGKAEAKERDDNCAKAGEPVLHHG